MGEPLILEVTDHRGRLRFRARLGPYGTTIGRGYRNDVILDDPYVDPVHLRIAPDGDGVLRWRDPGTVNGTWDTRHQHRVESGRVGPGVELRVGRSIIRFVSADHPVPAAVPDPTGRHGAAALLDPRRAALVLVVATAIGTASQYFASTSDGSLSEIVTPALASLLIAAIWATGWAFTNRIVAQRFRFPAHWAWTSLIATLFLVSGIAFEWLGFLIPSFDPTVAEVAVWWLLGTLLLVGHFQLVSDWPARRQWSVAAGVTLGLTVVIGILGRGSDTGATGSGLLDRVAALKPVSTRWIPTTSLDSFFERAVDLKKVVDGEAGNDEEEMPEAEQR